MAQDRRVMSPERLLDLLLPEGVPSERIAVIGIDGRSRSGKSTLAETLAAPRRDVAIVHTDDIAWHHSFFDWTESLVSNVLDPLRTRGAPISFAPQAWRDRGREGSIDIPVTARVVLIEGVGSTRTELTPWLDLAIWVETRPNLAMQRTRALDRDPAGFVDEWMRAENAHLENDRPWSRASAVVFSDQRPADPRLLEVSIPP